jgi:hypothetical protein
VPTPDRPLPNLVFLSFILSNLSTLTFNCCLYVCLNVHKKFTDFFGIILVKVLTYFLFSPHKEHSIYVNKDWQVERTVHIPLFWILHSLWEESESWWNPPTSIQSFFLFCQFFSDRLFKIRLRRSADVFADDVVLESSKGSIAFDMDKVYQGELEGILESRSHFLPFFSLLASSVLPFVQSIGEKKRLIFLGHTRSSVSLKRNYFSLDSLFVS